MQASLKVVSTPTADTASTAVVLNCSDKQYMIGNMGEAMQRMTAELGVRLVKTHDFFLTGRSEWRNLGGLLGMALTKADQVTASAQDKKSKNLERIPVNVFGPPNLNYTIATTRRIIFKRGMPLNTFEVVGDPPREEDQELLPTFVDDNLKLYPMSISPSDIQSSPASSTSSGRKRSHDEMNNDPPSSPNRRKNSPKPESAAEVAKQVVANMFNSSWTMDALVETRFSEVKLPAKLFWRRPGSTKIEPFDWSAADEDPMVLVREPWPATQVSHMPVVRPAPEAVSYFVKTCDVRGKFDVAKAVALNVPSGRARGLLAQGKTVQLENGTTITPDMILGPSRIGLAFAVIDLPTVDYVRPLVSRSEWQFPEIKDNLQLIVWILGPGVASDPVLKSFMEALPQVKHLVSSLELSSNQIMFKKSAGSILRMSKADEKRFKKPYDGNPILLSSGSFEIFQPAASIPMAENAEPLKLCAQYDIKPVFKPTAIFEDPKNPPFDAEAALAELNSEVVGAASEARSKIKESDAKLTEWWRTIPCPEAEVIALGTGSAVPSLYRNVSATLIRVPGYGSYLLDCGEGTLGQLQRAFSPSELTEILKDLRMIYLSHSHADHILGTVSVVKAWYNVVHGGQRVVESPGYVMENIRENPNTAKDHRRLALVASAPLQEWFREYSCVEDFGYSQTWPVWAIAGELKLWLRGQFQTIERHLWEPLFGIQNIQTCFVRHCHAAQAVSITWPNATRVDPSSDDSKPFKVSYSGDCRPSYDKFVAIGRHSTLLIHEATFADALAEDAKAKRHSTTSEALAVGIRMRAKCVLLTHFSQRYQKMPVMVRESDSKEDDKPSDDAAIAKEAQDISAMDVDGPADEMPDKAADFLHMEDANDGFAMYEENVTKRPHDNSATYLEMIEAAGGIKLPKEVAKADPEDPSAPAKVVVRNDMRVGFASDLMKVKMGEFAELEYFVPVMEKMFEEEEKKEATTEESGEAEEVTESKAKAKGPANGKAKGNGDRNGENADAGRSKQQTGMEKQKQNQKQQQKKKGNNDEPQQVAEEQ